jgi:purine-binding chemotaxis protein CheW
MPLRPQRPRHDAERSLVGFVVGDVTYAVEIASVREIVAPLAITALPHTPPAVAGVADHRGEVVPVVDLRTRFGLGPRSWGDRRVKWILVDVGGRTVGLVVDGVTEVFGASLGELRPAPELGGGEDARGIASVTTHAAQLVFVLDVTRFKSLTDSMERAGLLEPAEGEGR